MSITKPIRPKKPKHYVNNRDLFEAMVGYKQGLADAKKDCHTPIPNYVGECLMLIANKLANKPNFSGYSYRDEMISDGIENCIMYLHNFDPAKSSNPFAYFTQIIHFAFIRRIQKEKKQQYIKLKNIGNYLIDEHLASEGSGDTKGRELYENNQEYIKNYEKSLADKKKQSKVSGVEKFV